MRYFEYFDYLIDVLNVRRYYKYQEIWDIWNFKGVGDICGKFWDLKDSGRFDRFA